MLLSLSLQAKVWTVTDPANVGSRAVDPAPFTLQYYVNTADDGDTIAFDSSLSGATIKFDTTLVINTGLVIDASDLAQPIHFDGQKLTSIVTLGNASSKNESLQENTFKNIIFENGKSEVAGQGGAVNIFSYRITFDRCQFLNNENMLDNSNRQPGAIRNETSSSKMWIIDCVFRGNKTKRKGGAIAVDAPSVYINRCLFEDNHAGENGAVIAVKSTKDNVVLRDNEAPVLDIRNSTFVGNKCDQSTNTGSGLVIIHEDSKGIMPVRLFFNTFVGNVNEVNTGTVYSVYAANNNITAAGNIFGGNTHITEDPDEPYALCGDLNAGGGKYVVSNGYNLIYRLKHNDAETDPVNSNDVTYRKWLELPLLTSAPNADGVCVPAQAAIDSALWQQLKAMPMDLAEEFLGNHPTDQTGTPRESRLVFSGAYEFPAYVVDVDDDYFSVTEPGMGSYVYRKGETVTLASNHEEFVSWVVNGTHHVDNPYSFAVNEDCFVTVNYDEIPDVEAIENVSASGMTYTDGAICLNNDRQGLLRVYNMEGQLLLSRHVNANERVNFSKQGICIAVMRNTDGTINVMKF